MRRGFAPRSKAKLASIVESPHSKRRGLARLSWNEAKTADLRCCPGIALYVEPLYKVDGQGYHLNLERTSSERCFARLSEEHHVKYSKSLLNKSTSNASRILGLEGRSSRLSTSR